ncbi:OST3/OST6 family protein [Phialemonium atrogriseum]|uniref:OST3/OST6 family protein n=1 Tax=Phialemonium atrogriseum TaxID=1093897 RepID=A0AAJ0BSS5_9PEZI|nr:OST3/OST6 family protein [Phialemonium atrogriseum]KAK1762367.1 OST3/OST6 family protein [Phialemonium atrogriseum]
MRWLPALFSLSLLAGGSLAARKSTEDRFNEYHAKSLSSTPVKLGDASYKKLTSAPRDYSVAVLLTALEARFACHLCTEFQPEWELLSNSWTKGDKAGDSRLLFGTLDFSDGRDIFLGLGLQTAPVLLLFKPTAGPHAWPSAEPIRYDFTNGPQTAEQVHQWLARHTPDRPHPPVKRPINLFKWIVTLVAGSGIMTAAYLVWPYLLPIIQSRNIWAASSLIMILLFTSGHMFNHIRKVPYVAADGRGGISYFAGGFQNQFGLETQIIAAIYGILSFAAISLTLRAPRIVDAKAQQVAVLAWVGILFVVYSFLLSVFRIKNGGYPFSLPPFM